MDSRRESNLVLNSMSNLTVTPAPVELQAARNPFLVKTYHGEHAKKHDFIEETTGHLSLNPSSKPRVTITWQQKPHMLLALLSKRPNDDVATEAFQDACRTLWSHRVKILLDEQQVPLSDLPKPVEQTLVIRKPASEFQKLPVDFVIVFGGDGSLIRAARHFPNGCPPFLAFSLGSLGFLNPFRGDQVAETLTWLLQDRREIPLRIHARIAVTVKRKGFPDQAFTALNEAVISGAEVGALAKLQICSTPDATEEVTTFQGDGLILSTPTGSTAYSVSAGGSMVHPGVGAILCTPICPFSLSFRPILLPDYAKLMVRVAPDARSSARVSFDGVGHLPLAQGDQVIIEYSRHPMPSIVPDADVNWLNNLRTALHWNTTQAQKPLTRVKA